MRDWTAEEFAAMGERLRAARLAAGFPKAAEAVRRHGWSYSRYMNYENGERGIPLKQAAHFASAYGVSVEYLYFGANTLTDAQPAPATITPAMRYVPMLALDDIASFQCLASGLEPMLASTFPLPLDPSFPANALFIEVTDRSMWNSREPVSFELGDRVLVDLDARPRPSDFVLAFVRSETGALFRRYRELDTDSEGLPIVELVPLNANFRTIKLYRNNPGTILGVCRQLHRIKTL